MSEPDRTDELLNDQLAEANRSIRAPAGLEQRISRSISRRVAAGRIGAGASALVLALVSTVVLQSLLGPGSHSTSRTIARDDGSSGEQRQDNITPVAHRPATVRFEDDSGYFAREIPTSRPNVSIVRVYRNLAAPIEPDEEELNEDPGAAGPSSELTPLTQRSEV